MPLPSVPVAVSISDVLEVRGGPLRESEVWALLCQSAAAIQDFFIKGASRRKDKDDTFFAFSPITLTMCRNGQVILTPGETKWHGTDFIAPEHSRVSAQSLSDTAIEKMFLYTLGKTLQVATEYGLHPNQHVNISHHLDSLLEAMCEQNPALRIGLRPVLEACDLHTRQHPHKSPYARTISYLYTSVLGSIDKTGSISSDSSRQSTLTLRSRRRPRQIHYRNSTLSRSPSPTRVRSRSRSRSLNRDTADSGAYQTGKPDQGHRRDPSLTASVNTNWSPSTTVEATHIVTTTLPATIHHSPNKGPTSSQDLNVSLVSSIDDQTSVYHSCPPYQTLTTIPGQLGLHMGSPAFEKYLKLKERQRRLKAAKTGEQADSAEPRFGGALSASHLKLPSAGIWRGDIMDFMTDSRSMASLMSCTLGNYMPEFTSLDGLTVPSVAHDDMDCGSLLSSELSFLAQDGPQSHKDRPDCLPKEPKQSPVEASSSMLKCHHEEEISQAEKQQLSDHKTIEASSTLKRHHKEEAPQERQAVSDHSVQLKTKQQFLKQMQQFGSRDLTPTPEMPSREFYGPEFVYRASRPIIRISLPLQGESVKNPALARRVIIVHLTGQKFEVIVDPSMTGRQLFDAVVTHTALDDFFFFGLTYICEGEHFFIDADTKLHKMSPEGWREGAKGHMPPVTFTLYLRIKFYPDSLTDFRHASSQHLFYLQLRRDILEERCMADDQQLLSLSGLALHAEFGDYNRRTMGQSYFVPEQYLPARVARRLGMGYVHDRALEAHRDALSLAPSWCEVQFIKLVQALPEYGIHFYKLMKSKDDTNSLVWVGITQTSLLIAEQGSSKRSINRTLPWASIMKISFNKRRFSVQPKVDPAAHAKGKPPKINFFSSSYRKGRYLLQLATAQHRFHIRMRNRAAALEIMEGPAESSELQSSSVILAQPEGGEYGLEEEKKNEEEHGFTFSGLSFAKPLNQEADVFITKVDITPLPTAEFLSDSEADAEEELDAPPVKYRSPPPYHPNLDYLLEKFAVAKPAEDALDWLPEASDSDLHGVTRSTNTTPFSQSYKGILPDTPSKHQKPSYHHHSDPACLPFAQSSLGRHVFEVTLQKEGDKGIGITIVGGEMTGSLDLGIFVKSVLVDGPAARTGLIQAGDRLIAINGFSLEGVQHQEAVQMIKDSESSVSLLVSQVRVPATIKRKTNGTRRDLDVDDSSDRDVVCYSDDDADVEINFHGSLSDFTNNPCSHGVGRSHSHYSHPSRKYSEDSHSDFADIGRLKQLRTECGVPFAGLGTSELVNRDTDKFVDAGDEVSLSEEILTTAQLETHSYNSGDIRQALDSGTESDKEAEELDILGDIANMALDNSDSDSDFETAVQATIGERIDSKSSQRHLKQLRKVISVSSPDTVIYEVVLEKEHGSLGIIISEEEQERVKGDDKIYIQLLLTGGPADKGGIIRPGDCLLEVNNHSLKGATFDEVNAKLQSSPDLCVLKIARTVSLDVLSQNRYLKQISNQADSVQHTGQYQPLQFKEFVLGDSSEEAGQEICISPPSAFASAAATPVRDHPPDSFPPGSAPIPLGVEEECSNNTQSDVDSDVLDSSKSELERIYLAAENNLKSEGDCFNFSANVGAANLETTEQIEVDDCDISDKTKINCLPETSDTKLISHVCDTNSILEAGSKTHKSVVRHQGALDVCTGNGAADHANVLTDYQEFTVELQKTSGEGLGFTVVGGVSTSGGCFVKAVVQDPALSDGRLCPGDKLMQVNGKDMTGLSHFETVKFLRQTPKKVSLRVRRFNIHLSLLDPPQETKKNGPPETLQAVHASEHQERHIQRPRHAAVSEKSAESVVGHMPLQDAAEESQSQHTEEERIRCLDIPEAIIQHGTLREKCGKDGKSHEQYLATTQEETPAVMETSAIATDILHIVLEKSALFDSLGFSLISRQVEGQSGIFVKTLTKGGIAQTDGQLRVGDRILQVNGVMLLGCNHTKAIQIIREISGSVKLTISRNHEDSLESCGQGSASRMSAASDLDMSFQQTSISDSSSNSDNNAINEILDEALDLLESEDDHKSQSIKVEAEPKAVSSSGKLAGHISDISETAQVNSEQSVQSAQNRTEPETEKGVKLLHPSSRISEQLVNKGDVGSHQETENCTFASSCEEYLGRNTGYVRRLSMDIGDELTEQWFLSIPILTLADGIENRYVELLQLLADCVEQEEPMLEFLRLRHMKATDNSEVAKLPENKERNRYRNVLPYDFNRIKLQTGNNDYINASDVRLNVTVDRQLRYIVCQGPLAITLNDFWQMIWESTSNVVTMVTQEMESGKIKCHKYWPESSEEPLELGERMFRVNLLKEYSFVDFDIRHLLLVFTDTGEEREIIHLHYITWPDHGVPDTAYPLLRFLRLMHLFNRSGPYVVHCSAGIGRSGVLIAIDTALARIENGQEVDIFDIVSDLRSQRYGMIQTQDQYLFCYTACMEALLSMES